jgi:hypothetical protein
MEQFEKGERRASARAAAGLSIARLVRRGLLECCTRGRWRLTLKGLEVALRLEPDFNLPTLEELAPKLEFAEAISAVPRFASARRRKLRRTRRTTPKTTCPKAAMTPSTTSGKSTEFD